MEFVYGKSILCFLAATAMYEYACRLQTEMHGLASLQQQVFDINAHCDVIFLSTSLPANASNDWLGGYLYSECLIRHPGIKTEYASKSFQFMGAKCPTIYQSI